jgi:2-octaprenyl-6-methoxyphenol hydroxylase
MAAMQSGEAEPGIAPAAILGGGPIGMVCALLLARAGIASELVEARPVAELQRDRRLLALSHGSLLVLESLLGPRFAPTSAIGVVRVSSSGEPGSATLSGRDFGQAAVGATIWYADLASALAREVERRARAPADAPGQQPLIRLLRPRRALGVDQCVDRVRVHLDDEGIIEARLAIDAEGTPERAPRARDFALLADVDVLGVLEGEAIERFTRQGPLALLPLPPGGGPSAGESAPGPSAAQAKSAAAAAAMPRARRMSMIWCQPETIARERMALPEAELRKLIGQALGARIGAPLAIGPRSLFALATHRLERICEHRIVHLGNAAQSLHPVAGQGFNLGIRDCACLAEALVDARDPLWRGNGRARPGAFFDPASALESYRKRRRLDRLLLPAITSALPPFFSSRLAAPSLARSAGLIALDTLPGLRRAFARLLMYGAG